VYIILLFGVGIKSSGFRNRARVIRRGYSLLSVLVHVHPYSDLQCLLTPQCYGIDILGLHGGSRLRMAMCALWSGEESRYWGDGCVRACGCVKGCWHLVAAESGKHPFRPNRSGGVAPGGPGDQKTGKQSQLEESGSYVEQIHRQMQMQNRGRATLCRYI